MDKCKLSEDKHERWEDKERCEKEIYWNLERIRKDGRPWETI